MKSIRTILAALVASVLSIAAPAHAASFTDYLENKLADHLLHRYGSLIEELLALIGTDPSLARPLEHAPAYLRAEVAYACRSEGVLHLEDLMMRRTRLIYEVVDKGLPAVPEVAAIAAEHLGWDEARTTREVKAYTAHARAEIAAADNPDDSSAAAARDDDGDIAPVRAMGG